MVKQTNSLSFTNSCYLYITGTYNPKYQYKKDKVDFSHKTEEHKQTTNNWGFVRHSDSADHIGKYFYMLSHLLSAVFIVHK